MFTTSEYTQSVRTAAMKKEGVNSFREKPINRMTWVGLCLGVASVVTVPFFGAMNAVVRPKIDNLAGEAIGNIFGAGSVVAWLTLLTISLIINIRSFRKGERSWVMWVGLLLSTVIAGMMLLMIVAEVFELVRSRVTGEPMRY